MVDSLSILRLSVKCPAHLVTTRNAPPVYEDLRMYFTPPKFLPITTVKGIFPVKWQIRTTGVWGTHWGNIAAKRMWQAGGLLYVTTRHPCIPGEPHVCHSVYIYFFTNMANRQLLSIFDLDGFSFPVRKRASPIWNSK